MSGTVSRMTTLSKTVMAATGAVKPSLPAPPMRSRMPVAWLTKTDVICEYSVQYSTNVPSTGSTRPSVRTSSTSPARNRPPRLTFARSSQWLPGRHARFQPPPRAALHRMRAVLPTTLPVGATFV